MLGTRYSWRISVALRLRLVCVLLLVVVAGIANSTGRAAPISASADPDLCAMLPGDVGVVSPGVGTTGSDQSCKVEDRRVRRKWDELEITKREDPAHAHKAVQELYTVTRGEGWVPTTSFGDAGYAYEIPSHTAENGVTLPGAIIYARGCYFVHGIGTYDYGDPGQAFSLDALRDLVTAVDHQLQKAPCGGAISPTEPKIPTGVPVLIRNYNGVCTARNVEAGYLEITTVPPPPLRPRFYKALCNR